MTIESVNNMQSIPTKRGRGKARKTMALIEAAHEILAEIQPATVRAVCYRLFVAGIITSMSKVETNKVSTQLTYARENGIIPWGWLVDETREAERVSAWQDPAAYVDVVKRSYRRDRWTDQPDWIQVWSEKGTIRGTLAPILDEYGLTFQVMHGYGSATAIHQVATETRQAGRMLTVLYVGDWDPSGMHMSAVDLPNRLAEYGGNVTLVRLALDEDDVTIGNLPSFAAATKGPREDSKGDSRYRWYVDLFGGRCWELDALSPVVLRDRVERAVRDRLDHDAWHRAEVVERAERESLSTILNAWPGISGPASKYSPGPTEAV